MARKPFRVQLGGSLVAGVPGPQGPQGIQGPYYIPGISQTADDRFTMAFMGSQEHMPGVNSLEIQLPAGGSTHLLTADDRLDDLTGNGVWYMVDQPGTIGNLLEAAGIEQPAELTESQNEWTPMALIVTVTRGYQAEPDPENPTGLPHQQVSVYYVTSGETPETDGKCYRFQMDRVQVFKDYSADGNWTKWRSLCPVGTAPGHGQDGAEGIFVVNRDTSVSGLTFDKTFNDVHAAHNAGKTILLRSGAEIYYCAGLAGNGDARFYIFRPFVLAYANAATKTYKWLKLTVDNTWSENDTGFELMTEAKVKELIDDNVAPMCVNVVDGVANASFQEMLAAVDIGRIVIINDDSHNFIFTHKENNELYFARICDGVNPLHQKLCVSEDEIGENWIYWPEFGHEFTEEINEGSNNNYFVPTAKAVADYVKTNPGASSGIPGAKPMVYFELDLEQSSASNYNFNTEQIKAAIENGMTIVIQRTTYGSGVAYAYEDRYIVNRDAMNLSTASGNVIYYAYCLSDRSRYLQIQLDANAYANGQEIIMSAWAYIPGYLVKAYAVSV